MKVLDQFNRYRSVIPVGELSLEKVKFPEEARALHPTFKEFIDRAIVPALVRDFLRKRRTLEDNLVPVAESVREGSP